MVLTEVMDVISHSLTGKEPSIYSKIREDKKEIRLLTLKSLQSDQVGKQLSVEATLSTVSLDDNPRYCALSYAWGDPKITNPIIVNGTQIQVTTNLEAALRELRQHSSCRVLWADAICINQKDNKEKSWQVQQMREVYSKATMGVGWLGQDMGVAEILFPKIQEITNWRPGPKAELWDLYEFYVTIMESALESPVVTNQELFKTTSKDESVLILRKFFATEPNEFSFPYKHFLKLMENRYWTRLWVVQEFVLGRPFHFLWGSTFLVDQSLDKLSIIFEAIKTVWSVAAEPKIHSELASSGIDVEAIEAFTLNENFLRVKTLLSMKPIHEQRGGYTRDLLSLLYRTKSPDFEVSHQCDNIFGLIGIATDSDELRITIDYEASTAEVYCHAAEAMLRQGQTHVLASRLWEKKTPGLPSWVPDWSQKTRGDLITILRSSGCGVPYQAGGNEDVFDPIFIPHCQKDAATYLVLQGYLIDVVSLTRPSLHELVLGTQLTKAPRAGQVILQGSRLDYSQFKQDLKGVNLKKWTHSAKEMVTEFLGSPPDDTSILGLKPCSQDSIELRLARLLSCKVRDDLWDSREDVDELAKLSRAMVGEDDDADPEVFDHRKLLMPYVWTLDRTPFITEQGYLGAVPHPAKVGDYVIVVLGIPFPLVIREVDDGCFNLICDCYVDGIMEGQALNNGRELLSFTIV